MVKSISSVLKCSSRASLLVNFEILYKSGWMSSENDMEEKNHNQTIYYNITENIICTMQFPENCWIPIKSKLKIE